MNVTQDLSMLALIWNASVIVQLVMVLLLVVSFMSWYFIFRKLFTIRQAKAQTEQFERDFWSGSDLNALFQSAVNHRHSTGSLERIFEAGFREFAKLKTQRAADPSAMVDGARRAMRATYQREMDTLEAHLAFPRLGRIGEPLYRPARHGVGHHARVPRPGERRAGDAGAGGPGHRRGAGRHRDRPVRGDSRRWSPTTATRTTSTASRSASRASWRSSPTSCSARRTTMSAR